MQRRIDDRYLGGILLKAFFVGNQFFDFFQIERLKIGIDIFDIVAIFEKIKAEGRVLWYNP